MKSFFGVSHFLFLPDFLAPALKILNHSGMEKEEARTGEVGGSVLKKKMGGRFYSLLNISSKLKIVTFIFPLKYLSNTYGRYISTLIWGFHILGEIHKEASLEEGLRDPPSPTHTHVPGIETLTKAVL